MLRPNQRPRSGPSHVEVNVALPTPDATVSGLVTSTNFSFLPLVLFALCLKGFPPRNFCDFHFLTFWDLEATHQHARRCVPHIFMREEERLSRTLRNTNQTVRRLGHSFKFSGISFFTFSYLLTSYCLLLFNINFFAPILFICQQLLSVFSSNHPVFRILANSWLLMKIKLTSQCPELTTLREGKIWM